MAAGAGALLAGGAVFGAGAVLGYQALTKRKNGGNADADSDEEANETDVTGKV